LGLTCYVWNTESARGQRICDSVSLFSAFLNKNITRYKL